MLRLAASKWGASPYLRTSLSLRTLSKKAVDPDRCIPTMSPFASPHLSPSQLVGRDLAKLAHMAFAMRRAIESAGTRGDFDPVFLASLEVTSTESLTIVSNALSAVGKPCSAEELAQRINADVVSIPPEALDFRDFLKATDLRDELEQLLVAMNVLPPVVAQMDGSGKPFSRLDRRQQRREAARAASGRGTDGKAKAGEEEVKGGETKTSNMFVSPAEIALRKRDLEEAADISNVLKGFDTALLEVSRVAKVTRGGTTMNMRALIVIGNRAGTAGYGEGKSDTIPHAIERACRDAKRNLLFVDRFQNRTISHGSVGKYVQSEVVIWPSPQGRGISSNNNFNAVFQLFGLKDIGAKLHGPRSLTNSVKALFNGLSKVRSEEEVASTRGLRFVSRSGSARGPRKVGMVSRQ